LVKNGSERCVDDARNHSHVLRSLFNFNYYEGTTDRGIGVREKSKQLVELLGDDERVREERNKAKQLREKFGGNLGGVSSGGGGYSGGGGGGSGGSQYAGYGNDDYGGYSGGSSGYGDSGIGASSGFSGRYNDTNNETPTEDATPTFAAVPVEKKKKKSKKSKKKKEKAVVEEEVQPAPAAAPGKPIGL
jgi:epsin